MRMILPPQRNLPDPSWADRLRGTDSRTKTDLSAIIKSGRPGAETDSAPAVLIWLSMIINLVYDSISKITPIDKETSILIKMYQFMG